MFNALSLAWIELRLTLTELMRHFTFVPSPGNDMTPIERFILRPKYDSFVVKPYMIDPTAGQ